VDRVGARTCQHVQPVVGAHGRIWGQTLRRSDWRTRQLRRWTDPGRHQW
jgi:hypothetical protein